LNQCGSVDDGCKTRQLQDATLHLHFFFKTKLLQARLIQEFLLEILVGCVYSPLQQCATIAKAMCYYTTANSDAMRQAL